MIQKVQNRMSRKERSETLAKETRNLQQRHERKRPKVT
jgi:hypothetical protein